MVEILLDYYFYLLSYLSLKSKNVVKFCVHMSPIFSCPVTNIKLIKTSVSLKIEIKEKYTFLWFRLLLYVIVKSIYIILKRN